MEILKNKKVNLRRPQRLFSIEMLVGVIAVLAAAVVVWALVAASNKALVASIAGIVFIACLAIIAYLVFNPDSVRAHQTNSMLHLSGEMVDLMALGLTADVAQSICALLLPNTAAIAVAITDTTTILGYVGYMEAHNPQGANIRTQATRDAIADGRPRIMHSAEEIGLPIIPGRQNVIKGAIIVPLRVGKEIRGTLKFYYKNPAHITETQKSIAMGFGGLLSTQIAASELEEQRELATAMELKMLQNQINPHFLFNTINTIASFIRTDPPKAYVLLRDFAVFYRATLENAQELIPLSRELQQTIRYFSFETARFGEDRLGMTVRVEGFEDASRKGQDDKDAQGEGKESAEAIEETGLDIASMKVPPFLLQPLVENAVKHAMPATGKLTVNIWAETVDVDILVHVEDDGVGMSEEDRQNIMHPESSTGLGIAVKNVHDRMHGYFGENAEMLVDSELGVGTVVTLRFPGMVHELEEPDTSDE